MYNEKDIICNEEKMLTASNPHQQADFADFKAYNAWIASLDESTRMKEYALLRNRAQAALEAVKAEVSYETIIPCLLRASEHFAFSNHIEGAGEEGWQLGRDVLNAATEAGMLKTSHRRPNRRQKFKE